jgi:hypothetical protein
MISDLLSDILAPVIPIDLVLFELTAIRIAAIVAALAWFLVCFFTYFGSTRWIEEGEKVGILSLFFFILWIVTSFGVVIAFIVNNLLQEIPTVITLEILLDSFFYGLILALAPTLSALLGISNKSRV